jgi:putative redox protein
MRHTVFVRGHALTVDATPDEGGEDAGPSAHDLYDAALGACKALTLVWYARHKGIALEDVEVTVERDASGERQGVYKLDVALRLGGQLTEADRAALLTVAGKCPVHKLMTEVTTEITTRLA